jgi:predicted Rossmann fold nucleotide-binding protein DprA/Smf involved in DNA uptake
MKSILLAGTEVAQCHVYRGSPQFPGRLVQFLGDRAPQSLWITGSPDLVSLVDSGQLHSVALAASVDSPAGIAGPACNLVRELARSGVVFVGGFHSRLERLCLGELLAAGCPAIVCLGQTLAGLRVPPGWRQPLREAKLVLASACGPSQKRATRDSVRARNECVAALADCLLIPYATAGGKTEELCQAVIRAGKPVWTLNHPGSRNLVTLGAKLAAAGNVSEILNTSLNTLDASSELRD